MFAQYQSADKAWDRAFACKKQYPDYEFSVAKYNDTWAIAVLKP